jgi:transcriptional regulator with XRE-family HTH domain
LPQPTAGRHCQGRAGALHIKAGEIIKARREERSISLVDFAKKVGISPGYLSQLENGRKDNPSLDVMLSIAQELDLDIDMLLGLDQDTETPALRMPSLIRLVIAKDRNLKTLEDREVQRKVSNLLDRVLQSRYLIEDNDLYGLFLEDLYVQTETTLKRYMSIEILKNMDQTQL